VDHTLFARLPLARGLVGGGREEGVSLPTPSALRDHCLLTILQDLGDDLARLGVAENRTRRHRHDDVRAPAPALVRPHAVLATLGHPVVAVSVVEQRREIGITADDDAPAAAAIAAVGAAHRGPPFSSEGRAPGSTGASLDSDYYAINEH